jgi:hypothetical protein
VREQPVVVDLVGSGHVLRHEDHRAHPMYVLVDPVAALQLVQQVCHGQLEVGVADLAGRRGLELRRVRALDLE